MERRFPRSMRLIQDDGNGYWKASLAFATVLLAAWAAWLVAARVPVIVVSLEARVESGASMHPVESQGAGRVVVSSARVGRSVAAGEVLFELDAAAERLGLAEERSRAVALRAQIDALGSEVAAAGRALAEARRAAGIGLDEADAQASETDAAARLAEDDLARAEALRSASLGSEADLGHARIEAERRRLTARGLTLAAARTDRDRRADLEDRTARLEGLRRELVRLEGLHDEAAVATSRLELDVERKRVRAPVAGRIGEVAPIRPGGVVAAGDRLAAVIPPGALRLTAEFDAGMAIGRIRAGQPARMRLDGFSWAQYGTLPATVTAVADEARESRVRVELDLTDMASGALPLQHGLPGTVEVEVARERPVTLLLRAAGALVARP